MTPSNSPIVALALSCPNSSSISLPFIQMSQISSAIARLILSFIQCPGVPSSRPIPGFSDPFSILPPRIDVFGIRLSGIQGIFNLQETRCCCLCGFVPNLSHWAPNQQEICFGAVLVFIALPGRISNSGPNS